jgi:DNA invertase Pin-like site-specific DNA recombinase
VYIRQSTTHQVVTNQESLRLQYALRQRAIELGWHEASVDVIDADLGISGASAAQRSGFKELVGRVGLKEVGLILSIDVTRLAATARIGIRCSISAGCTAASSPTVMASMTPAVRMGDCCSA